MFGNDKVYDEFISLLSEATVDGSGAISCAMSWDKELFMLKGGKLPHGVIVSSMRLLVMNLHEAMKLEESGGTVLDGRPLYGLNLESDGKRKLLLNGWNFQSLGAHTHTHARAHTHTHTHNCNSFRHCAPSMGAEQWAAHVARKVRCLCLCVHATIALGV